MSGPTAQYGIDTCSLTALRRVYPNDVFPGVWAKVSMLAHVDILTAIELVLTELEVEDDEIWQWARTNASMFCPLDEPIQLKASKILSTHPNLIDLKRRKSAADPFIVAHAIVHSCVVVTEEKPSGGPHRSKIPDVCKAYGIGCIPLIEMLRREGLRL